MSSLDGDAGLGTWDALGADWGPPLVEIQRATVVEEALAEFDRFEAHLDLPAALAEQVAVRPAA
jgi:hypothetical protein